MSAPAFRTDFKPDTEGLFLNVPMDVYQAAPGESKSALNVLMDSPLDYYRWKTGLIKREETDAMRLGTILHLSAVERTVAKFHVRPETYGPENKPWNANAKECKAWIKAHADAPIYTAERAKFIESVSGYVANHPKASGLLSGGHAEVSCFARDPETGLMLKGRLDYIIPGDDYWTVPDLKSTIDASTRAFERTVFKLRYYVQAGMYRKILKLLGVPDVRYYLVALETGQLPKLNVKELNPRAMEQGEVELKEALQTLIECRKSGVWPEWIDESATGAIQHIDLPEYAYDDEITASN
jgi:hypothetical protein